MEKIVGWQYQRVLPQEKLEAFEMVLEPMASAIDVGEAPQEPNMRVLTAFFPPEIARNQLTSTLELAEKMAGIADKSRPILLQPVHHEDWQQKMYRAFPPIVESGFFIHGFDETVPEDKIGLRVPAGMAFGTGEHATTAMCLHLYEDLSVKHIFKNGLDMGTGSGILAMAAAKVQKTKVLAVDIDPDSVTACQENVINNGVETYVIAIVGDGVNAPGVQARKPYDLVFANILKNPLIQMAKGLTALLDEGGFMVLSGFNTEQAADVVAAYEVLGLKQTRTLERDGWCAVALQK